MANILLANINHARRAHDLVYQVFEEMKIGIAIITEPYTIPSHSRWASSTGLSPKVAAMWRHADDSPRCYAGEAGEDYLVLSWGDITLIGVYLSPTLTLTQFKGRLAILDRVIAPYRMQCFAVLGDFNARSPLWDSTVTGIPVKGAVLLDWAQGHNLTPMNEGRDPTCVRPQGMSTVDLLWASPTLASQIRSVRVLQVESLSDHLYLVASLRCRAGHQDHTRQRDKFLSWNYQKLDPDHMMAAAEAKRWSLPQETVSLDVKVSWLSGALQKIADAAMPRSSIAGTRKVYWWTADIDHKRRKCMQSRRQLLRARAKRRTPAIEDLIERLHQAYKDRKRDLCIAIKRSKGMAWQELLDSIDQDPWGKPYLIVMRKLQAASSVCETLLDEMVRNMLRVLFPWGPSQSHSPVSNIPWDPTLDVIPCEIAELLKRVSGNRKAPGPDGIRGGLIKATFHHLAQAWVSIFNDCLRNGLFPKIWKTARVVLIKKKEGPIDDPGTYRPICLLSETGKTFERIINTRIQASLRDNNGLSEQQYGFRKQRSTVDAIESVRTYVQEATSRGESVILIGIDIKNAFNSIPWRCITRSMMDKGFPPYLRAIIHNYLKDRFITYIDRDGVRQTLEVSCGVPQGSVLGPTLWNIAYDPVLQQDLPEGCSVRCYADDTLLLAMGRNPLQARTVASFSLDALVRRIETLGLRIAESKTEAMLFSNQRLAAEDSHIWIKNTMIPITDTIKYLGVTLDAGWTFRSHFKIVLAKALRVSLALSRIMPNLRGPRERKRRLYSNVVTSIIAYGAPIWAPALRRDRWLRREVHKVQRRIGLRVCCAYRTVSHEAVSILARIVPMDYLAERYRVVYTQIHALRREGVVLTHRIQAILCLRAQQEAYRE